MASYDDFTRDALIQSGLPARESATKLLDTKGLPANTAGIPGLLLRAMPVLDNTNVRGMMLADSRTSQNMANRGVQPNIFIRPDAPRDTIAHEAEHLLARQNLGYPSLVNKKFDELVDNWKERGKFVKNALDAAPYLKEKYGIENAYFDPEAVKEMGGSVVLYEQLASLAGAEAAQNVDLTKDPVLRKTLFKDKNVRETYNAITGLRQTRLDPRDLPPYTRQPEKEEPKSMGAKLKELIGYANGGYVAKAGNKKDI